jgi:hypothetical protein
VKTKGADTDRAAPALLPCPFCGAAARASTKRLFAACSDEDCPAYIVCAGPEEWNRRAAPKIEPCAHYPWDKIESAEAPGADVAAKLGGSSLLLLPPPLHAGGQVSGPDELLARDIADVEYGCSQGEHHGSAAFMVRTSAIRSILTANAALAARCEKAEAALQEAVGVAESFGVPLTWSLAVRNCMTRAVFAPLASQAEGETK